MKHLGRLCLAVIMLLAGGLSSAAAAPVVLFDQGHGQRFVIETNRMLDLSHLAALFSERGYQAESTAEPLSGKLLNGVEVLVISGAFSPFTQSEMDAIVEFVQRGGNLLLTLHVGPLNGALLKRLGVSVSMAILRQQEHLIEGRNSDFAATSLELHPLTEALGRVNFYGAWALRSETPRLGVVARSGNDAWLDMNRNQRREFEEPTGEFAMLLAGELGAGKVVVSGDDAIFQNRFLQGDNLRLAKNLIRWFSQGSQQPGHGALHAQLTP